MGSMSFLEWVKTKHNIDMHMATDAYNQQQVIINKLEEEKQIVWDDFIYEQKLKATTQKEYHDIIFDLKEQIKYAYTQMLVRHEQTKCNGIKNWLKRNEKYEKHEKGKA